MRTGTADTTSQPGQSYFSTNGTNWTDLYTVDSTHSENFAIDALTIPNTPVSWVSAVSGQWIMPGNWTGGLPNAFGAGAVINAPTTAALTITIDAPQTICSLLLGNSASSTVGYTLSGSGGNTLTFNNSGSDATITVTDGTHLIAAPVILADNLVVTSGGTNSWTLSFGTASSITDNGSGYSLTMDGAGGTLILSGSDSYYGGTTILAGTLDVTDSEALPYDSGVIVGADGTLVFGPSAGGASLDAISLPVASPVPEPGTFALLGVALWSAAIYRRFRFRRRS